MTEPFTDREIAELRLALGSIEGTAPRSPEATHRMQATGSRRSPLAITAVAALIVLVAGLGSFLLFGESSDPAPSVGDTTTTRAAVPTTRPPDITIEGAREPFTFEETQSYGEFGPLLWGLVTTIGGIEDIPHGPTYEWVTWGPLWGGYQAGTGPIEVYGVTDLSAVDPDAVAAVVPFGTTIILREVAWSRDQLEDYAAALWAGRPDNGVCSTGFGATPNRVSVVATSDLDIGAVPPGALAIEYVDLCQGTMPAVTATTAAVAATYLGFEHEGFGLITAGAGLGGCGDEQTPTRVAYSASYGSVDSAPGRTVSVGWRPTSSLCPFEPIPTTADDLGPPADPPNVIDHGHTTVLGHDARVVEERGVFQVMWLRDDGAAAGLTVFPGDTPLGLDDVTALTTRVVELTPAEWATLTEAPPVVTTTSIPPSSATHTMHLYVSNQSFAIDPVDIQIRIDGELLVSDTFEVLNQHNWIRYDLELTVGEHVINATALDGEVELHETFQVAAETWSLVEFWDSEDRGDTPFLRWITQDEPIGFA